MNHDSFDGIPATIKLILISYTNAPVYIWRDNIMSYWSKMQWHMSFHQWDDTIPLSIQWPSEKYRTQNSEHLLQSSIRTNHHIRRISRDHFHSTSQGAVVVAGVPRVSTSADLTVCSRCVVDAAVAMASLGVADLWHGARVGVPVTVAGHTHACGFK